MSEEEIEDVPAISAYDSFRAAVQAGINEVVRQANLTAVQLTPESYGAAVSEGLLKAHRIVVDKIRQWDEYEL